jgi:putative tryptophan/tyrosine transport system substrate-binding protein
VRGRSKPNGTWHRRRGDASPLRDALNRRSVLALVGGAVAWPFSARAQEMPVVGLISSRARSDLALGDVAAFREGLGETGYVEGRNVAIEYRWAAGQNDRLPALAAELVQRRVAVIAAMGGPAALAAKAATATVPIVFGTGDDPVKLGLVASLNRPGGNLTGQTGLLAEVAPKRLEMLRELVPAAATIGALVDPANPAAETLAKDLRAAAATMGVTIEVLHARTAPDLDAAFAALVQRKAGGLVLANDAVFNSRIEQLVALAARHGLPAIYPLRAFALAGGLMSYGGSVTDGYRQVGIYAGRVLAGARPADLPVQQAVRVELVINVKTAKTLGLAVPQTLLVRANEIIE